MSPETAAVLIEKWHGLAVGKASAEVACADFSRVNSLAGAAADEQHGFWDNPSDLTRLLKGEKP